jgi:ribonuclease HI
MRYMLGLLSIKSRHSLAQAKAYMRVTSDRRHPLHRNITDTKGKRIKRGASWMAQAETMIEQVSTVDTIVKGEEWINTGKCMTEYHKVIITLGRECREWGNGKADLEIKQLIDDNAGDDDAVIYTDGSVLRGLKSGWGFSARVRGKIVAERSEAYGTTTSSMRMEVEAVTAALRWLSETKLNRAVIVSDSQSMLRKIQNRWLRHEWKTYIETSALQELVWIYCPGHAGVCGNERADVLASKAQVVGTLDMDKGDI